MHRTRRAPFAALVAIPVIGFALATPAAAAPTVTSTVTSTAPQVVSVVHPGGSIQAAIDAAPAGGTVTVTSGTYAESLTVTKPITLVGRGDVVISPPTVAPDNACTLDPDSDGRFPGVCVVGRLADPAQESSPVAVPVTDVHLGGVSLHGFTAAAVEIYGAKNVTLDRITATGNAGGGVFAARSAGVKIRRLTALHNGARAVDIHENVVGFAITHSLLSRNHGEGVFVGDSSSGLIAQNNIGGNCTGILLVDLALPGDSGVSDIRVTGNHVTANNTYCAADAEGQPAESGNGIVLVGARSTTVDHNLVRRNAASQKVDLSFGGIAVLDAGPLTHGAAPSGDAIVHNVVTGNAPMDLLYDGSGAGNTVRGNVCARSTTVGACIAGN
jgi:hypothetical protein